MSKDREAVWLPVFGRTMLCPEGDVLLSAYALSVLLLRDLTRQIHNRYACASQVIL